MEKKTKPARFTNAVPATASQANNKFWNFVDSGGDSAELQLFGTISSEEDWWSDDCVTYRNFINELKALGDKKNINVLIQSGGGDVPAANAIYTALTSVQSDNHGDRDRSLSQRGDDYPSGRQYTPDRKERRS